MTAKNDLMDLTSEFDQIYADAAAEPYLPENRPEAQLTVKRIPIDPNLRPSFFITDNSERDGNEMNDWWCQPFIQTHAHDSTVYYTVWCLDGGAWDRPTWWDVCETLWDAILVAKVHGPKIRRMNKSGE